MGGRASPRSAGARRRHTRRDGGDGCRLARSGGHRSGRILRSSSHRNRSRSSGIPRGERHRRGSSVRSTWRCSGVCSWVRGSGRASSRGGQSPAACRRSFPLRASASRAAALAAVVVALALSTRLVSASRRRGRAALIGAGATTLLLAALVAVPASRGEGSLGLDALARQSVDDRFVMWAQAWEVFLSSPLLGVGPSGFEDVVTRAFAEDWYLRASTGLGARLAAQRPHAGARRRRSRRPRYRRRSRGVHRSVRFPRDPGCGQDDATSCWGERLRWEQGVWRC